MYSINKAILTAFCVAYAISSAAAIPNISFQEGFNPEWAEIGFGGRYFDCKKLYDEYLNHRSIQDECVIPKIIHLIWLGSPLPKRCQRFLDSWKDFHPDWEVILWTDEDVDSFNMVNKEAFNETPNKGQKSDIWRYEILYRYGGLYVDTDFLCLKNFEELHKSCEFYVGCISSSSTVIPNSIIGSRPGHPIMEACIKELRLIWKNPRDFEKIMHETGPYYLTNIIFQCAPELTPGTIAILPPVFFFPFPAVYRRVLDDIAIQFAKPESMAMHYWACSWQE